MIESVHIRDFGCVKDVELKLTPLHALIGPNDSGKSTLLRAIGTVCQLATATFTNSPDGSFEPFAPEVPTREGPWLKLVATSGAPAARIGTYAVSVEDEPPLVGEMLTTSEQSARGVKRPLGARRIGSGNTPLFDRAVGRAVRIRLDPDALRRESPVLEDRAIPEYLASRGNGLPGALLNVKGRDDDSWFELRKNVGRLFPVVAKIDVKPRGKNVRLEFELTDGTRLGAGQVSDGLLYFLAFASLQYLDHDLGVLLVEEPENGLHPARVAEVVSVLRALVSRNNTQVILATHSPLVINELRPDEVSVVTRDPVKGTQVTPIAETPNFAERSEVYALGELWLAYADGESEKPLLSGGG